MEQLIERCAGLDVHKQTVSACVRVPGPGRGREQHVRRFGTTVADLLALREWLEGYQVTHVAIAYASHCTSLGRCETFSGAGRLFDNLTPLAFCGG
jgi:hypothetical protein